MYEIALMLQQKRWFTGYTLSNGIVPENCILRHKYLRYLHKTIANVFTILSATEQARVHFSSTNIGVYGYVINSSTDGHYSQCVSAEE